MLALLAAPAAAETVPAPAYFAEGVFASSTAEALARACPTLTMDPIRAARMSEEVLRRLARDGFDPANLLTRMDDPAPAIAALQDAFLARHGLADDTSPRAACAAGHATMEEGTPVGALLREVE